ncbi:MAG: ATP-binding cassette domain-containing protein [Flavobacteriaceae bacterium]|nr:ATP-binding cassette domain-containing protein [Flavobacteriaceae bacterium]
MLHLKIDEKSYGRKSIFSQLTLDLQVPGVYGLVGKNGVGKTTLLECIAGQTSFKGGMHWNQQIFDKSEVAWCPTHPFVYEYLNSTEFSRFFAQLMKIEQIKSKVVFDVPERPLIKEFSTGMKKKAYLNALFQKEYTLYLFDEVFNGLDMESVFALQKLILSLGKTKIVMVSSHIIDSLFKICDAIFWLNDGRIERFERNEYRNLELKLLG